MKIVVRNRMLQQLEICKNHVKVTTLFSYAVTLLLVVNNTCLRIKIHYEMIICVLIPHPNTVTQVSSRASSAVNISLCKKKIFLQIVKMILVSNEIYV